MSRYDEDLYENPFFVALQKRHSGLFDQATTRRWIICIPKYSVLSGVELTEDDFRDHILVPTHGTENGFNTVSNHKVTISQGRVNLGSGFLVQKAVPILFEETFYNNSDESYRVLCVAAFFNKEQTGETYDAEGGDPSIQKPPTTYEECLKILWDHPGGSKTKDNLDRSLATFSSSFASLEGQGVRGLLDAVCTQLTKAMQIVLKDPSLKRAARLNEKYMENLKIAVEMYMMNVTHKKLFSAITTCESTRDATVNKMTRNLTDIRLRELGVRQEFERNLPLAKKELAMLNKFSTPLGRLHCLKRVVTALTRPPRQMSSENEDVVMTTDDFLPILIYLIIKSQIPNWMTNLMYMKHFHLARCAEEDELSFYLATTEAALDYIHSGKVKQDTLAAKKAQVKLQGDNPDGSPLRRQGSSGTSVRDRFFQYVQFGDESAVQLMLKRPTSGNDELVSQLCHPLCTCDKCQKLVAENKDDSNYVTPFTRDDMGHTALHVASLHGQAQLIDILIKCGSLVDASDYLGCTPLHLACQKGFQNVILMLVHFGSDISALDNDGNTPLHLCAANGHEDCVKAILFLDILKNRLNVNARNDMGDTPLHLAVKWGYEGIVRFLLESEADPRIRNRKKQTPVNLAQNAVIQRILQEAITDPPPQIIRHHPTPSGFEVVDVKQRKRNVTLVENPETMSPTTPVVASLDQADTKQKERLFKAIQDGDIQLVRFYLGWGRQESVGEEEEEDESPVPEDLIDSNLCHPLCQCHKCRKTSKTSNSADLSINCVNSRGFTPLHVAILHGCTDIIHLFLRKEANINAQTHKSITPLHLACYRSNVEIAKMLVEKGASVNMRDQYGEAAVHLSCAKKCVQLVKFLLQKGAVINYGNRDGNTPLHVAVVTGCLENVQLLVEAGADLNVKNNTGYLPLDLAKTQEIYDYLAEKIPAHSNPDTPSKHLADPVKNSVVTTPTEVQTAADLGTESIQSQPTGSEHAAGLGKGSSSTENLENKTKSVTENVSVKELFAGFEEEDLKNLKALEGSIRTFDKKKSLRRIETIDYSASMLDRFKYSLSIERFDPGTLRHVETDDHSSPVLDNLKHSLSIEKFDVNTLHHVQTVDHSAPVLADLKHSLSIEHFDTGTLKHVETRDRSAPELDSLKRSLSIEKFDPGSLKHVETADHSAPMHVYSRLCSVQGESESKSEHRACPSCRTEEKTDMGQGLGRHKQECSLDMYSSGDTEKSFNETRTSNTEEVYKCDTRTSKSFNCENGSTDASALRGIDSAKSDMLDQVTTSVGTDVKADIENCLNENLPQQSVNESCVCPGLHNSVNFPQSDSYCVPSEVCDRNLLKADCSVQNTKDETVIFKDNIQGETVGVNSTEADFTSGENRVVEASAIKSINSNSVDVHQ